MVTRPRIQFSKYVWPSRNFGFSQVEFQSNMTDTNSQEPNKLGPTSTSKGRLQNPNSAPYLGFNNLESTVRREIEHSIHEKKHLLSTLPRFSEILNGLRPGELTVFTGPTGCGKTTVLSQMSLDYCCQGLPTLWGSFEIKNTRLAHVMLQQLAMTSLVQDNLIDEEAWERATTKLKSVPLTFMNLFGSNSLNTIFDAMEASMRQRFPPHLIILDNLQFMLSGQASGSLDKWELMEHAIMELRAFCNSYDVHVILVIHPRKEIDDTPLGLASVSGTAKATQEADNVIILQKLGERRYLDVKKNRYYGDLGRVRIRYLPESRLIMEMSDDESMEQNNHTSNVPNSSKLDNSNKVLN